MGVRTITVGERFWSKVKKTDEGCWEWTRAINQTGYGMFSWGHANWRPAHRVAFFLANGRWPSAGMFVCHKCDNRRCCNPDHLFEGTARDNMQDCVLKGRINKPHPKAVGQGNHQAKLTWKIVDEIRTMKPRYGLKISLARKYGLSRSSIERIFLNQSWVKN
jgi:hypothetical protein